MGSRRSHGEGSVYRRGDGRWVAAIDLGSHTGRRQRKTRTAGTKREALGCLQELRQAQRSGSLIMEDARTTVAAYLGRWLQSVEASIRPRTWVRYEELVRLHIVPELGAVRLNRLTPMDIQVFHRNRLASGCAPRSVLHMHRVLHTALEQAVRWDMLARNPARYAEPPRVPRTAMRVLNAEEAQRLLSAAEGGRLEALFALALGTGARQGELLALRWRDVDFANRRITINATLGVGRDGRLTLSEPKTPASRRTVRVPDFAVEVLRRHRASQNEERLSLGEAWHDPDLVFATGRGTQMAASDLNKRHWRPLVEKAELGPKPGEQRLRFHDLRHTFATLSLQAGVNVKVISAALGHSNTAITLDTYSHVLPGMDDQAAEVLAGALGRATPGA